MRQPELPSTSVSGSIKPTIQPSADGYVFTKNGSMETAAYRGLSMASWQMVSVPRENYFSSTHRPLQVYASGENGNLLLVPETVRQLPDVERQRKAILRKMKKAERRNEKELAKSYRSSRSFRGASTDRWFAAGIAPYHSLAVGAQQYYGYNASGSRGIASDYIPAPYLQFHVTDRVHLLSEFQFHSPQATPNILLAQKTNATSQSAWNTENTYLRKMYYFNIPLSFYYSPIKNIYIGSGVQFSSFNSGLAYRERLNTTNNVVQSEIIKVREDSLSSLISSSEWRYLVDANYYINRFMLGVRYNQALSPYVNLKGNTGIPAAQARNQAMQFYLRFNLVEAKRKK